MARVVMVLTGSKESVAALGLLINQGYNVTCLAYEISPMKISENTFSTCLYEKKAIEKIANHFHLDLEFFNITDLYHNYILDRILHDALKSRHPHTCVPCNTHILYGPVYDYAINYLKGDLIATWHNARSLPEPKQNSKLHTLYAGIDKDYDESYLLFQVPKDKLTKSIFPIGNILHKNIEDLCEKFKYQDDDKATYYKCHEVWFTKKQGNAFIKKFASDKFIKSGQIVNSNGDVIEHHYGHFDFEIGDTYETKKKEILHIIEKNPITGNVTLGPESALLRNAMSVREIIWLNKPKDPIKIMNIEVKVSMNHYPTKAKLTLYEGNRGDLVFNSPQKLVKPGHYAVFYNGPEVIGGGLIENVL